MICRKLTWQLTEGNVVLKGTFQAKTTMTYEITVRTIPAVLLLELDKLGPCHPVTVQDLMQRLQMTMSDMDRCEEILKRVLHSLSCNKQFPLVRKTPASSKIKSNDAFVINDSFVSKRRRFQLPMASLEDVQSSKTNVEHTRRAAVDAAIVCAMFI